MAIAAVEDVLFVFGARLDSEPDLSGDMLGVNDLNFFYPVAL